MDSNNLSSLLRDLENSNRLGDDYITHQLTRHMQQQRQQQALFPPPAALTVAAAMQSRRQLQTPRIGQSPLAAMQQLPNNSPFMRAAQAPIAPPLLHYRHQGPSPATTLQQHHQQQQHKQQSHPVQNQPHVPIAPPTAQAALTPTQQQQAASSEASLEDGSQSYLESFPYLLFKALNDAEYPETLRWSDDGGAFFVNYRDPDFLKALLSTIFKFTTFKEWLQTLRDHGWKEILTGHNKGMMFNAHFHKKMGAKNFTMIMQYRGRRQDAKMAKEKIEQEARMLKYAMSKPVHYNTSNTVAAGATAASTAFVPPPPFPPAPPAAVTVSKKDTSTTATAISKKETNKVESIKKTGSTNKTKSTKKTPILISKKPKTSATTTKVAGKRKAASETKKVLVKKKKQKKILSTSPEALKKKRPSSTTTTTKTTKTTTTTTATASDKKEAEQKALKRKLREHKKLHNLFWQWTPWNFPKGLDHFLESGKVQYYKKKKPKPTAPVVDPEAYLVKNQGDGKVSDLLCDEFPESLANEDQNLADFVDRIRKDQLEHEKLKKIWSKIVIPVVNGKTLPPAKFAKPTDEWKKLKAGDKIGVYWRDDALFYNAVIQKQQEKTSYFHLMYDADGSQEWLDLSRETIQILDHEEKKRKKSKARSTSRASGSASAIVADHKTPHTDNGASNVEEKSEPFNLPESHAHLAPFVRHSWKRLGLGSSSGTPSYNSYVREKDPSARVAKALDILNDVRDLRATGFSGIPLNLDNDMEKAATDERNDNDLSSADNDSSDKRFAKQLRYLQDRIEKDNDVPSSIQKFDRSLKAVRKLTDTWSIRTVRENLRTIETQVLKLNEREASILEKCRRKGLC